MQGFHASVHDHSRGLSHIVLRRLRVFSAPPFLAYLLGAILLTIAAVVLLTHRTANNSPQSQGRQMLLNASPASSPAAPRTAASVPSTAHSTFSSTASDGSATTRLNVNGQNIPVPADGASHQTTINNGTTHTTVNTSRNQASNTNSSTSNISVHVQSDQSSEGGDTQ